MSCFGGPEIVSDGLILCLDASNVRSCPGSGNTVYDLSSSLYNASVSGGITYKPNYFSFSGSASNDMDCGPCPKIGSTLTGFTIEAMVRPASKASKIIAEDGTDYTTNTFYFAQENANYFSFEIKGPGNYHWVYSSFIYQIGTWYHLVGTWSPYPSIDFYCNGVLSSGTKGGSGQATLIDGNTNLKIGKRPSGSLYYDGDIGFVRIYDKTLTPAEIQQNFNATRGRYGI